MTLAVLLGLNPSCVEEADPVDPNALAGFRLTLVDTSGLGESPFPFPSRYAPVVVSVEALRRDGSRKDDYTGTLQVRVVPGEVDPVSRFVRLEGGINEAHTVPLRFSFGAARIWVEEVGIDQSDECRDGFDNDGNGRLDFPGDPGCFGVEDPSEGTASYVTGLTDPVQFDLIDIRDVQFNPDAPEGESPLLNEAVVIERGTLVVTNVTSTGFYITDLEETEEFGSIFLFNFNFPDGVRVGDKMTRISGGVDEFQQGTQLTFPDWQHDLAYELSDTSREELARCQRPSDPNALWAEPIVLSATELSNLERLEEVESAVVRIENARVSERFVQCDFDGSGRIDGSAEENCRGTCQNDVLCTELSNFEAFDQFNVAVGGAAAQVAGATTIARFDPRADCTVVSEDPLTLECPERQLISATGTLRHIFLTRRIQLWEIIPRFACDIVLACGNGTSCPTGAECVDGVCQYP